MHTLAVNVDHVATIRQARMIDELTQLSGVVVATGGGAVLDEENRRHLAARGIVVYLHTSVGQQLARTRHSRNRPLLDTEDLARVTFPDIWGGFDELVLDASQRYAATSVLIGRVRPDTAQRNRWTYHFAEAQRAWTGEPELVINLVADMLAAEFAIGGDAVVESVELGVAGINTVDAYGSVQRILSGINVVDSFAITAVDGDRILYRVQAHGGAERLARALRLSGLVEQGRPLAEEQ